jgi:hypothetical protein
MKDKTLIENDRIEPCNAAVFSKHNGWTEAKNSRFFLYQLGRDVFFFRNGYRSKNVGLALELMYKQQKEQPKEIFHLVDMLHMEVIYDSRHRR